MFFLAVAFLALAEVAPVTHAVTNTVKRVVIILASIIVFKVAPFSLDMLDRAMANALRRVACPRIRLP